MCIYIYHSVVHDGFFPWLPIKAENYKNKGYLHQEKYLSIPLYGVKPRVYTSLSKLIKNGC